MLVYMGLLKATDVEYVSPDPIRSPELPFEESGYEMGEAVVFGDPSLVMETEDEDDETTGEWVMGEPIIIGPVHTVTPELDETAGALGAEELVEEAEAEPAGPTETELLVDQFSGHRQEMSMEDLDLPANPGSTIIRQVDEKVRDLIQEYRHGMQESSRQAFTFLNENQRERLVSEAFRHIGNQADPAAFEQALEALSRRIDQLAAEYQERLSLEAAEQREALFTEVDRHIEETISQQRIILKQEADAYIHQATADYKQRVENDHELLGAANRIVQEREKIMDEAYQKSLAMLQEAETEAQRMQSEHAAALSKAQKILEDAEGRAEEIRQEAQQEGERIIADANLESARIIEAAEQSHQEIIEAATQEGFNVGYQEGREEAIKENAQLLQETTAALNKLHGAFPVAVKQNEEKLVRLALEIAQAVIEDELAARPEIAIKTVERAVKRVSDLERVIIKVNPLDLDLVLPKQEYFRNLLPDVQEFIITGHYAIGRGGCLIETNSGTIDAQISTQLAVVEEVFNKVRAEYDDVEEEVAEVPESAYEPPPAMEYQEPGEEEEG